MGLVFQSVTGPVVVDAPSNGKLPSQEAIDAAWQLVQDRRPWDAVDAYDRLATTFFHAKRWAAASYSLRAMRRSLACASLLDFDSMGAVLGLSRRFERTLWARIDAMDGENGNVVRAFERGRPDLFAWMITHRPQAVHDAIDRSRRGPQDGVGPLSSMLFSATICAYAARSPGAPVAVLRLPFSAATAAQYVLPPPPVPSLALSM